MLYDFGPYASDLATLVLRIGVGVLFLLNGYGKLMRWNTTQPLMRFIGIMEPLGALGVLAGVLMQPAALGLSIILIGAISMHKWKWHDTFLHANGSPGWAHPFITLAGTLALLILGDPGVYAIVL